MYQLPLFLPADVSPGVEILCDASLLTLVSAPLLWSVLVSPLRMMASDQSRKYTAIVEGSRDGILILNNNGLIESANAAATHCFGFTRVDVVGKPLSILFPDFGNQRSPSQVLHDLVESTSLFPNVEKIAVDIQGAKRHFEVSASLLSIAGAPQFTLLIRDVTEQYAVQLSLEETNKQLVDAANRAGKAEVATCVIHNVGNVLTNVNVLTSAIASKVRKSRLAGLSKGAQLIQSHSQDLSTFLTEDIRGQQLPEYFVELSQCWEREAKELLEKLNSLSESIEHANNIVDAQQDYADEGGWLEQVSLNNLLQKSIAIISISLERHSIQLETEVEVLPMATTDPQRLLQVLVNLLTNAKESLCGCAKRNGRISVRLYSNEASRFRIEVSDNGSGISQEDMSRIFSSGFTTKEDGHGFGLHYCSNAIRELGGYLDVTSDGPNTGATFAIDLPFCQTAAVN